MIKEIQLAALAQEELREARDWYEKSSPGLGLQLVEAVDRVLDKT